MNLLHREWWFLVQSLTITCKRNRGSSRKMGDWQRERQGQGVGRETDRQREWVRYIIRNVQILYLRNVTSLISTSNVSTWSLYQPPACTHSIGVGRYWRMGGGLKIKLCTQHVKIFGPHLPLLEPCSFVHARGYCDYEDKSFSMKERTVSQVEDLAAIYSHFDSYSGLTELRMSVL